MVTERDKANSQPSHHIPLKFILMLSPHLLPISHEGYLRHDIPYLHALTTYVNIILFLLSQFLFLVLLISNQHRTAPVRLQVSVCSTSALCAMLPPPSIYCTHLRTVAKWLVPLLPIRNIPG
jgi:hypothetical protein